MDRYPSPAEVESELLAIEDQVKRLQERRALLLKYREIAALVALPDKSSPDPRNEIRVIARKNGHKKTSVEFVQKILSEHGPLSTHMIVHKLKENGWQGADTESRNWGRIAKTLEHNPDIFERVKRGVWAVKPERKLVGTETTSE